MHIIPPLKHVLSTIGFFFISWSAFAYDGSGASQSSADLSSQGLSEIVSGSNHILAGSSQLTIAAIKEIGHFTYLTLKTAKDSVETTIKISSILVGDTSLAVGSTIQVSTVASGYLLYASGEMLAFIPNELGKQLIYSEKL